PAIRTARAASLSSREPGKVTTPTRAVMGTLRSFVGMSRRRPRPPWPRPDGVPSGEGGAGGARSRGYPQRGGPWVRPPRSWAGFALGQPLAEPDQGAPGPAGRRAVEVDLVDQAAHHRQAAPGLGVGAGHPRGGDGEAGAAVGDGDPAVRRPEADLHPVGAAGAVLDGVGARLGG